MILLLGLTCLNILLHTALIGSGTFSREITESYMNSFIGGSVIYIIIVGVLAAVGAYLRKFSLTGFSNRFIMYAICIETFFVLIHVYQGVVDWFL